MLRAGTVAGAVAVVVAVSVVLDPVGASVALVLLVRTPAHDRIALHTLGLDSQTPIVLWVDVTESLINVRVRIGDVLQLVVPLFIYQRTIGISLLARNQASDVLPREYGQLLELANLHLVVIVVILVLQTVKGMLYVQHILLRDALSHIATRIKRNTREVLCIQSS